MNKFFITMLCVTHIVNAHYYFFNPVATPLFRLSSKSCAQFNVSLSGTRTTKGYNSLKDQVDLLETFGIHNFAYLGITQQNSILDTIAPSDSISDINHGILHQMTDEVITQLINKNDLGTYGHFKVNGKFSYMQGQIQFNTPSYKGFHAHISLPFSHFSFSDIEYTDLTPATGNNGFNLQSANWTQFKNRLDAILEGYKLNNKKYKENGIGDLSLGLYYVKELPRDTALSLGGIVVCPTSKKKNENYAFSCPHGFDGHTGFKTHVTLQKKFNEYFIFAMNLENVFFNSHDKKMHIKTYEGQEGFLFLAQDEKNITRKKGHIVEISSELRATLHKNFGVTFGYHYSHSNKTTLKLHNDTFETAAANSDKRFDSWYRHSLHTSLSYNFSNISACISDATLAFSLSIPISGKNIFKSNVFGGAGSLVFSCHI